MISFFEIGYECIFEIVSHSFLMRYKETRFLVSLNKEFNMIQMSGVVVSLLENINDTHKKGIWFVEKSIDNKISSIREFYKTGGFLDELYIECKKSGVNFTDTLEKETDVSESTSKRYRKIFTDEKTSKLIEDEDESRLRGINNLGLMKLYNMSMLSDEDFETVVGGDNTPLDKKKVTPPPTDENESDVDTSDSDDGDEKGKDENGDNNPPPPSVPTEFIDTLGDEYLTLITNDKVFLVSRISEEITKKQKLEKEIVELKLQLKNLSPQREV